jgi:hypothetical protein
VGTVTRIGRVSAAGLPVSSYTEKEWQRQVEQLLDMYGWDYRYHVQRAERSPWGWPDLVAARRRDRRLLFAELKSEKGEASDDQLGLLELLLEISDGGWHDGRSGPPRDFVPRGYARVDVELWRPGDVDRVMAVLR